MIKKIVIFLIIAIVVALGAKKLLSEKERVANQKTPLMLSYTIETTKAKQALVEHKRSFLAQLQSDKEIKIATKLSGIIKKVFVSESQFVKKGELLVKIDDKVLQTNLKTLRKNLKVQNKDVEYYKSIKQRDEKLYKVNAISKQKYDATVLAYLNKKALRDSTKDKIEALKSDLTYLDIKAPIDGVVSFVFLHEGDLATTAKPIIALNSVAQKLQFSFAGDKNEIKLNDKVFYNSELIGYISKIYPNAKNNLNVAEVYLDKVIKSTNDSYISIDVVTKSLKGCSVVLETLLHTKDGTYVLVYDKNRFNKVKVNVLLEDEKRAIISPCIDKKLAMASESKLSILPFYKNIVITGKEDE